MRPEPSLLTPLLRSPAQGRLLAEVLLHPERETTVADLARATGDPAPSVLREVDRLAVAGVLRDRRVGRARVVRVDAEHPLVGPLTQMIMLTYGPLPALREAFAGVAGVDAVWVFGSWAERASGVPGSFPNDVDVLVVGDPDPIEVFERAADVERIVGLPVNPTTVGVARWDAGADGFVRTVRERPLIEVDLEEDVDDGRRGDT